MSLSDQIEQQGFSVVKRFLNFKTSDVSKSMDVFDLTLSISTASEQCISKRMKLILEAANECESSKKLFKSVYLGSFQRSFFSYSAMTNKDMVEILSDAGIASPYMAADPLLMISGHLANSVLNQATLSPYHQDWASMQSSQNSVVCWIPLTEYNETTHGTIKLFPKSHKKGLLPTKDHEWFETIDPEFFDVSQQEFSIIKGGPGDLVIFSSLLVHSTVEAVNDLVYQEPRLTLQFRFGDYNDELFKLNSGHFNYSHCSPQKTIKEHGWLRLPLAIQ